MNNAFHLAIPLLALGLAAAAPPAAAGGQTNFVPATMRISEPVDEGPELTPVTMHDPLVASIAADLEPRGPREDLAAGLLNRRAAAATPPLRPPLAAPPVSPVEDDVERAASLLDAFNAEGPPDIESALTRDWGWLANSVFELERRERQAIVPASGGWLEEDLDTFGFDVEQSDREWRLLPDDAYERPLSPAPVTRRGSAYGRGRIVEPAP